MMWWELASEPIFTLWNLTEATITGLFIGILGRQLFTALGRAEERRRRKADEEATLECLNDQAESAAQLRRLG